MSDLKSGKNGSANKPVAQEGKAYHLDTAPGSIAARCLLVGSPERAMMIGETMIAGECVGNHRGLISFTGRWNGVPVSVVTTGMGSASAGIVLPEAVASGARAFIRVGSCGALWEEVGLGESLICTAAVRLDGASDNWAPIGFPAVADYRIVAALKTSAMRLGARHRVGIGATTTCFNEGQSRPDQDGYIPQRLWDQHRELVARGVLFYSMEEATIFVWCATHGGYPCGAVDAVYANRMTNAFGVVGDRDAAEIALNALALIDPEELLLEQPIRRPRTLPSFPSS